MRTIEATIPAIIWTQFSNLDSVNQQKVSNIITFNGIAKTIPLLCFVELNKKSSKVQNDF
jgi:chorismate mutase